MSAALAPPTLKESTALVSEDAEWSGAILRRSGEKEARIVHPASEGFDYWTSYLRFRVSRQFDAVVAITGEEGNGKSTLALRIAQALYHRFSLADLCYTADDVLAAYERAVRGHPIIYDEGVRGLLAGETFSPEQVALVKALTLVRESGAVLIICIPSIHMLAKQLRGRRATLWIHVKRRGLGQVFERDHRLKMKDKGSLNMTESPSAPRITWKPYNPTSRLWQDYSVRKRAELASFLSGTRHQLGPVGESRADRRRRVAREGMRALRARRRREEPSENEDGSA